MMDAALQQRVLTALRKSPWLFGSIFDFKMEERDRIILQGTVASYFLKQVAQETLRTIEGIPEIQNEVCVMKKG
ncbi:MAG: BON domain-containing protein [Planctomycetia bacterium]|nr:BON domain-containing protein [Planctomycetia bacterium]